VCHATLDLMACCGESRHCRLAPFPEPSATYSECLFTVESNNRGVLLFCICCRLPSLFCLIGSPAALLGWAAGLDRHVKIYSVSNRLCRRKVYLKQRLNVVLFGQDGDLDTAQPAPDGELGDGQAAATPEEEEDAVWEELEASAATKKHKSKSDGSAGPKRRRKEKQVKE
jgi:hypothetical protein